MDFAKIRYILFFALLAIVTIGFFYVIKPFAYPIFWAAVIAGICYPIYKWLNQKLKSRNLSSLIVLIGVVICIIIPIGLIGTLLVKQSVDLYSSLDNNQTKIGEAVRQTSDWIKHNSVVVKLNIDEAFWTAKISEVTQSVSGFVFKGIKSVTQNSLTFVVMFIIMLYTLFYFIRDGEKLLKKLMHLCPLGDQKEKTLYNKFTKTTYATLKGILIIGAIQASLGTILFLLTGVQGALIWGVVMLVLSVIPSFSSAIVWFPTGIIMLVTGHIWQGIVIILVGLILISTIDNFLRPIIIGNDTQLHPLLILFSMLGGFILFGISGFIIGPIISALLVSFWEMYDQYYQTELEHNE
ncbi:MAG: hypothetical protein COU29_02435 [Candidatus Magasanikbacteria bacterium CG10_big_fil_rev_8_21_14_0_10_36_32]|uniref:AI-2E family transporter n=1 Tax=Candidatus Magasanikbacteria bacterium CG10_big_fil_rev_8_21_14_0_10_36_32 TaxID=1974646 RepID=A0A2M6W732_9BACT|nr:MAG: hypothetical protein COU29_02435 [Candidatus Magasanikbacteria bacterium CG10_big_fil_rev_8_21_14_0_10_36_32]